MSIVGFFSDTIINVIRITGYYGILTLMILESALLPVPSEIIMPFAGFLVSMGELEFWGVVVSGVIGNLVGSLIAYYIGAKIGRPFLEKYGKYLLVSKSHIQHSEELFKKYGSSIIFIGRILPAIRTVISFPAGLAKMNIIKFSLYTFIGSVPWCIFLTYVGIILQENWYIIQEYTTIIDITIICVIILVLAYYIKKIKYY